MSRKMIKIVSNNGNANLALWAGWLLFLTVIIGFAVLAIFWQPASGAPLSQTPTATPTYNPTLGPTTRYRRPVSAKFQSTDRNRAVVDLYQVEVGPKPSTPSAYTNAVTFMEGYVGNVATQLRQEIANSGGGSGNSGHRIIDLSTAQNLYIGGGSRPAGLAPLHMWATLDYVEGSIVLLEGGKIIWLERPNKGYEFTIILERDIDHRIESYNWNSGWFATSGTDRGLANDAVNSSTGQPNLFPKPPWGQQLKVGDILDVSTPIASQPEAILRVRGRKAIVLGSEGVLNIRQNRWVGQAAGNLVRSVREMNGVKVLIEDKIPNASHSVIYLDRLQTPTVFPQGWYIDFFTSQATQNTQNVYGAPGQVIFLASDQTITYDPGVNYGPYPQGQWYRLQAVEDDKFHLSLLNRPNRPTPTPVGRNNAIAYDMWYKFRGVGQPVVVPDFDTDHHDVNIFSDSIELDPSYGARAFHARDFHGGMAILGDRGKVTIATRPFSGFMFYAVSTTTTYGPGSGDDRYFLEVSGVPSRSTHSFVGPASVVPNKLYRVFFNGGNSTFYITEVGAPTPTPQPTKSWHIVQVDGSQLKNASSSVYNTCGGEVKDWTGRTNDNSNQLGIFRLTEGWERIKFVSYDAGGTNLYYTEEVSHPGTFTNGVTSPVNGTPQPLNPQQYAVTANFGVKMAALGTNTVTLYHYDNRRAKQQDRTLGSFRANDITTDDFCFISMAEWR